MLELSIFFIVALLVIVTSYFISEERNRERKAQFYYGKSLMTYREGDYYTSIKYLKKALIIPSSQYINKAEATLNLKVLDLTDLVMLQLNMDSTEVTLGLRKFLSGVNGVELHNTNRFDKVVKLHDQLLFGENVDQAMLTYLSRSHLKIHRNTFRRNELELKQRAV